MEKKKISCSYSVLVIILFATVCVLTDYIVIDRKLNEGGGSVSSSVNTNTNDDTKDNTGVDGNIDDTLITNSADLLSEENALAIGNLMFDKASSFYLSTLLTTKSFCGESFNNNNIVLDEVTYNKASKYSSIQEVKNYLLSFLSSSMVDSAVTDFGYKEIDGQLYCLASSGKGFLSDYTGNKKISVVNIDERKINYSIEFVFTDRSSGNNSCQADMLNKSLDLSLCSDSDLIKVSADFVIEKNEDGRWIVTKFADYPNITVLNRDSININYYE